MGMSSTCCVWQHLLGLLHDISNGSNMGCALYVAERDRHGCPCRCAQYIEQYREEVDASHCEAA